MDQQQEYDKISELAVSMAKLTTREKVIQSTWLPFTLLYEQMVKRKEIEPIGELPNVIKRKYWDEATGNKIRRIWVAEALYVYDLIKAQ